MYTKLHSKMAKNCCCHSNRKFNYFCCNLSAGAVKPFNDILGRNTDHLTCNEYRLYHSTMQPTWKNVAL